VAETTPACDGRHAWQNASPQMRLRKLIAVAVLWIWLFVLFATHFGARSPYSYGWPLFGNFATHILGTVVNPDAVQMMPAMFYFYEGAQPRDWPHTYNFGAPYHAFLAATFAAFTRSYLLANYAVNLGALMLLAVVAVNFARRRQLPLLPVVIGLLTISMLPFVITYIGQPMSYIAGITISFLAVIAAGSLDEDDLRRPWLSGLLAAILLFNYDSYIYAAAVVFSLLFVVRFRRALDYGVFVVTAALPTIVWKAFLRKVSHDQYPRTVEVFFIRPIVNGWMEFLRHPLKHFTQPFIAGEIGLNVGTEMILAMIYWPLLLALLAGLWQFRDRIPRSRFAALVALLPLIFFVHQWATAPFDWENNPRRALPVVLAAGVTWCWIVTVAWQQRAWRAVSVAMLLICATLGMMDALFDRPAIALMTAGQTMQRNPKEVMSVEEKRLTSESLPTMMIDTPIFWRDLGQARKLDRKEVPAFLFAQLFNAALLCGLVWLLARAKLLPRYAPLIAVAVWLASAVRYY